MSIHIYSCIALLFYHYNLSFLNFIHILRELDHFYGCENVSSLYDGSSHEMTYLCSVMPLFFLCVVVVV